MTSVWVPAPVWVVLSSLVHVTLVPTATDRSGGSKGKWRMGTCSPDPDAGGWPGEPAPGPPLSSLVTAAPTAKAPHAIVTTAAIATDTRHARALLMVGRDG